MSAEIDPLARVDAGATLGPGCRVGARSTVARGAYLHDGVQLGADVTVGPNVAFVARDFAGASAAAIVVRDGASIGANATVLGGVTVEHRAVIGAGAVVTRDVPAYAVVVGSPARIVGYASSPTLAPSRRLPVSTIAADDFPVAVGRATLRRLPEVLDLRGALAYGEFPTELPFVPQRFFLVYDVPSREVRGEHAHRELHELLVCVHGEIAVAIDDGEERAEVVLDRPYASLHLPPRVWSRQYRYSPDAVLLVLASDPYEADDYVRDYDTFRAVLGDG